MRPGELVTRDELRRLLWTAETFVDFEVGLNSAVRKLREALDDSADNPRFVETVPRHGYRFVGPVVGPLVDTAPPAWTASDRPVEPDAVPPSEVAAASLTESLPASEPIGPLSRTARWRPAALLFVLSVGIGGIAYSRGLLSTRDTPTAAESIIHLTSNPSDMFVTSAHIAPDGRHLAFADRTGLQVRFIDSGRVHRFADSEGMNVYGWTPDSASVLASHCDDVSCVGWVISLVGQDRHRTGAVWSRDERVLTAPDGQRLLKHRNAPAGKQSLSVDPMNGLPAQEVATGDVARPSWSADGKRVVFIRFLANTIESVPAEGGPAIEVFRGPKGQLVGSAIELADRTFLISMMPPGSNPGTGQFELWKAHLDRTGVVRTPPRRLTWNGANPTELTVSSNGRVAFLNTRYQSEVYVADGDLRGGSVHVPRRFTLSDSNNSAYTWTPDSAAVLLSSNRHGTLDIFKQRLDSDIAEPFLNGPEQQGYPGVTSDARWVLYTHGTAADANIMRTPLSGGATAEVAPHVGSGRLQCAEHGRCVLLEPQEGKSFVISSLHPLEGKGNELARIPITNGFRLLPDGDTFAYILPTENGMANRVRLLSFIGKPDTDIVVKDAAALIGLGWPPSSSGFLTTDRGRLLLVFPDGTSKVLWAPTGFLSIDWAVPSPDERHLVINVRTRHGNVWMLSGF